MKKTLVINSLIFFFLLFFLEFIVRFFDLASVVGTSKNLVNFNEELNFNNKNAFVFDEEYDARKIKEFS